MAGLWRFVCLMWIVTQSTRGVLGGTCVVTSASSGGGGTTLSDCLQDGDASGGLFVSFNIPLGVNEPYAVINTTQIILRKSNVYINGTTQPLGSGAASARAALTDSDEKLPRVIVQSIAGSGSWFGVIVFSASNVHFHGLGFRNWKPSITGAGSGTASLQGGLTTSDAGNVTVTGCYFENCSFGIDLNVGSGVHNIGLPGWPVNTFVRSNRGVFARGGTFELNLHNCVVGVDVDGTVVGNDLHGIETYNTRTTVSSSSFHGDLASSATTAGILARQSGLTVTDTHVEGYTYGVFVAAGSQSALVQDSIVTLSRVNGVYNAGQNTRIVGTLITNSTTGAGVFMASTSAGSSVGSADGACTIEHSGREGVYVTSANVVVANTTISDSLFDGILFLANAPDGVVRDSVVGGSGKNGISVLGTNVTISSCYVGISDDGVTPNPNTNNGIEIANTASDCSIVSDPTSAMKMVVSGNRANGMVIEGTDCIVEGVIAGLDASATVAVPNVFTGLLLSAGGVRTMVGGSTSTSAWNIFSGNEISGVDILANDVTVERTLCGLGGDGITRIGNHFHGANVRSGVTGVTIGGSTYEQRVVLSGNGFHGLLMDSAASVDFAFIGTTMDGLGGAGNTFDGVFLRSTTSDVGALGAVIGSSSESNHTVVSGNGRNGITVTAQQVVIRNVLIGVGVDAHTSLGNGGHGIEIRDFGNGTTVTSTFIAYSHGLGMYVWGSDVQITRCWIGVHPSIDGSSGVAGNGYGGVLLAAPSTTTDGIGGTGASIMQSTIGNNGFNCSTAYESLGACGHGLSVLAHGVRVSNSGFGLRHDANAGSTASDFGNAATGVIVAGSGCVLTGNLVGFHAANSGVSVHGDDTTLTHNVVGVPPGAAPDAGQNCSNHGYGIVIEGTVLNVSANRVAYSKFGGIRADHLPRSSVVAANTLDFTNNWGNTACERCICDGSAPEIHVNCNDVDWGSDFPKEVPEGTSAVSFSNTNALFVNWTELMLHGATLKRLDLTHNPNLKPLPVTCDEDPSCSLDTFTVLEELSMDGTDLSGLGNLTFQPLKDSLSLLSLVSDTHPAHDGVQVNLEGFGHLMAIPWYNTSLCPQGYYSVKTTSDPHQLCFRCPRNTYGTEFGGTSDAVCETCADGKFDYDNDPVTPCSVGQFRLRDGINGSDYVQGDVGKYTINETHQITGPSVPLSQIFEGYADDDIDEIFFVFRSAKRGDASSMTTFTNAKTGDGSLMPSEKGNFTVTLDAIDLSGSVATLASWSFESLPDDTTIDAYGPNGTACVHGVTVDAVPLDQSFTCDCTGTSFTGANCETSTLLASSSSSEEDKTTRNVSIIVAVILLVLLIVVFAVMRYQLYLERHKPADIEAMQEMLLEKLGISATEMDDKHCGVVVHFDDLTDVRSSALSKDVKSQIIKRFKKEKYGDKLAEVVVRDGSNSVLIKFHSALREEDEQALARIASHIETKPIEFNNNSGRRRSSKAHVAIPKRVPREVSKGNVMRLEMIGRGAFAEVYRGLLTEPKRGVPSYLVAMKMMLEAGGSAREDLLEEAALQGTFDHRNIVGIVGVVTIPSDMPAILLMTYCEHGSLLSYLAESDVAAEATVADLLTFCSDVAKGMQYLQQLRFVHRDIAARNVLVDSAVHCKIADFGMSMGMSEDSDKEYVRINEKAAIRWCSPEALADNKYSPASDVWAFGVLVHEIFTYGEKPYRDFENASDVIEHVKAGNILPRDDLVPEQIYNTIMLPCFSREASQRPNMITILDTLRKLGGADTLGHAGTPETVGNKPKHLTHSKTKESVEHDLSMDGVSVYHLTEVLMKKTEAALQSSRDAPWALKDTSDATIWHMVQAHVIPSTKKKQCTYVQSLKGSDHVGHATALLSYCWAYRYTDVVRALRHWCEEEKRDPKRTYIWICSLCVNQHEAAAEVRSTDFFKREFGERVKNIGMILPLLLPWDEPVYLTRAWCLFELYTAISFHGQCKISAIFTPEQGVKFKQAVSSGGYSKIDETLNSIRSEKAKATVAEDESSIKTVIVETLPGGFQSLDNMIRAHLLEWFHSSGAVQVSSRLARAPVRGNFSTSMSLSHSRSQSIEARSRSVENGRNDSLMSTDSQKYVSDRVRPDRPRGYSSLSQSKSELEPLVTSSEDIPGFKTTDIGRAVKLKDGREGVLRFVGMHKTYETPRVGIELSKPIGRHNGTVNGIKYFECPPRHGILAEPKKVSFVSGDEYLQIGENDDDQTEFGFGI